MKNRKWRLMPIFGTSRNENTISKSQKYCKVEPPIACEKASLLAYGPYLYLFGGYGPAPEQFHNYPVDPIFDLDPTSSWGHAQGWNANVYRYCIETESWEWIHCKGQHPSARCGKYVLYRLIIMV